MTDEPQAADTPVGWTQAAFMELSTSERARLLYEPEPLTFEHDAEIAQLRG